MLYVHRVFVISHTPPDRYIYIYREREREREREIGSNCHFVQNFIKQVEERYC